MLFFVVGFLVGGLLFGWIGTLIARNQGVSPSAGFLWGFFLGPLGLIIVALLRPEIAESAVSLAHAQSPAEAGFRGDPDLSNDSYKIWLTSHYNIQKNEVLGSYVCEDRLFPTVDAALEHARDEHHAELRRSEADAERWTTIATQRSESGAVADEEADERRFTIYAVAAAVLFVIVVLVGTALLAG